MAESNSFDSASAEPVSEERSVARDYFRDVIALSPMATGGNLPYRQLCCEFGADRSCSEMVLADKLVRGGEKPLLRHHESELHFGVQLCGKQASTLAEAAQIAVAAGARFIDLNFGCPIDLIVRRGSGAALLKRPRKLAELVAAVRAAVTVPLSVKIRSGFTEKKINAIEVASLAAAAGADAIGVHGRTRAQRYKRSADWKLIGEVAAAIDVPVLGNGDLLTSWDLEERRHQTGLSSFLVARGALIKPWIFRELKEGRTIQYDAPRRWRLMRRYHDLACAYFGDDMRGLARVQRFFLWHLKFWHRFRNYCEEDFRAARPSPLMQVRQAPVSGTADDRLLSSAEVADHELIWQRVRAGDFPGI